MAPAQGAAGHAWKGQGVNCTVGERLSSRVKTCGLQLESPSGSAGSVNLLMEPLIAGASFRPSTMAMEISDTDAWQAAKTNDTEMMSRALSRGGSEVVDYIRTKDSPNPLTHRGRPMSAQLIHVAASFGCVAEKYESE